jgi:hypothetical protein
MKFVLIVGCGALSLVTRQLQGNSVETKNVTGINPSGNWIQQDTNYYFQTKITKIVNTITTPANWIRLEHRIGPLMCREQYDNYSKDKLSDIQGWKFVNKSERVAHYVETDENIVVFRGTIANKGLITALKDMVDNFHLSIGNDDSVDLVKEGRKYVKKLIDSGIPVSKISLTGHSLGGYAALKVSQEFSVKSFVFNPAASALRPVTNGPGPLLSTVYHIVGDAISSHMADNTSTIIRAYKNSTFLQTVFNHALARFDDNDPIFGFWGAKMENDLFIKDMKKSDVKPIPGI